MKKIFLMIILLTFLQQGYNQSVSGINYQTMVHDSEGNPLTNTAVSLKMSIRSDSPDGNIAYTEVHDVATNQFGIVNLKIGEGIPQTGIYKNIDWAFYDKFLETAVDLSGTGNYATMGITQFLHVPYAYEAEHSKSLTLMDSKGKHYKITIDTAGNLVPVLLIPDWYCGRNYIDTSDWQSYETVAIGDQCWLSKNLNRGVFVDGSVSTTNNGIVEKYCYNNLPENCEIYGGLYKWDELMGYSTDSASQGICPLGWHIPTDYEWKILEGTVDSQYDVGAPVWNNTEFRGFDVGKNLKSTCGWNNNGNGVDIFEFSALAGGNYTFGTYYNQGNLGYWWSSTRFSSSSIWARSFQYSNDQSQRVLLSRTGNGFSVRCIYGN